MAAILVIDDETETSGSIQRVLEDAGHSVTLASSGQEALGLVRHKNQRGKN